jgi:hypothetical protein
MIVHQYKHGYITTTQLDMKYQSVKESAEFTDITTEVQVLTELF